MSDMPDANWWEEGEELAPRPWRVTTETDGDYEVGYSTYVTGVVDRNGEWVVRFDDDYGNNQAATAEAIVACVNAVYPQGGADSETETK